MGDCRVRGSGIGFDVDYQANDKTRLDKEKTGS